MGVEEILLQQAEDRGVKLGMEKGMENLRVVVRKLILKGKSNAFICDLLELDEQFVVNIRKELTR